MLNNSKLDDRFDDRLNDKLNVRFNNRLNEKFNDRFNEILSIHCMRFAVSRMKTAIFVYISKKQELQSDQVLL